jgi:hypothetical protein
MRKHSRALTAEIKGLRGEGRVERWRGGRGKREKDNDKPIFFGTPHLR